MAVVILSSQDCIEKPSAVHLLSLTTSKVKPRTICSVPVASVGYKVVGAC